MSGGVLVGHPTLNANVRQAALALAEIDLLAELHTSIAVRPASWRGFPSARIARTLARRRVLPGTEHAAHSHPLPELRRALAERLPVAGRLIGDPSVHRMYAAFDRIVARRVRPGLGAVLGYEDGAEATFEAAAQVGLPCVYDLPIPYWRMKHDLLEAEAEANPAWAPLLGGLADPHWVLDRKSAELAGADLVLTASSLSTASARAARPDARIVQIGYGCPPPVETIRPSTGGPPRVLYVGSLTQRKGLSYLFDAMSLLGDRATLTVVGTGAPAESAVLDAALARHTHVPSVPNQLMGETMRAHDVLVLPSLVEGFGLVLTEALAQGVPIVATDRTGAPGLLGPDLADWLVPAADASGLAARLESWARDTDALNAAKSDALDVARRNPWSRYRAGVQATFRDLLG